MATLHDAESSKSTMSTLRAWGSESPHPLPPKSHILTPLDSSLPPMTLATLITALHFRPFQTLPMLFPPVLAFSSYLSVAGWKGDSAGLTAAWSGLYVLLASRRRQPLMGARGKFSLRGGIRLAAMGLGLANCVAGCYTYLTADRKAEEEERREMNKWGMYRDE